MKKILVFIDWFTPGFRAGGPIKSIANFVQWMHTDYEIYVYTSDRDLGQTAGYANIIYNQWIPFAENINIRYATPEMQNSKALQEMMSAVHPDFVYVNSMFSKHFSIAPLALKNNFTYCKFILAPRGMLRKSALAFKPYKKKIFLQYAKMKGLYKNVFFHATDATEVKDIREKIAADSRVLEISNCPAKPVAKITPVEKKINELKIIFIGRVHPIKNLYFFLQVLEKAEAAIQLSIVGVMEDEIYWNKCQALISRFPASIQVKFLNELPPAELEKKIEAHHVLALPTQGENFGHAIYETLALGRPVIISDQTPWRHLAEKKAGWDLPLNNIAGFKEAVAQLAATNQEGFDGYCKNAYQLAFDFYTHSDIKEKYLQLFS